MVVLANCTSRPLRGCVQVLAASVSRAGRSIPRAGGALSRCPTTAKRKRAHAVEEETSLAITGPHKSGERIIHADSEARYTGGRPGRSRMRLLRESRPTEVPSGDRDFEAPRDRDWREKSQQLPPLVVGPDGADERLQKCQRQRGRVDGRAQAAARRLPELGLRKKLLPEGSPPANGPPIATKTLTQFTDAPRGGPLPHGGHEHDDGGQIDLPAEKSHGGGRSSLAATIACAAKAQAGAVLFGESIDTTRLPRVVGHVQPPATRTAGLASRLRKILIDRKKKRPEAGIPRQVMVHRVYSEVVENHTEYTPRRPRSSDQAFRGDFFETPQKISIRNRKIPTDYLDHAQQLNPVE